MLYIHLLGHLRLFDSQRIFEFSGLPKTLPLLAYLLLHREKGPIGRDTIAFTLWADETEERAKANLRRHLYDLQQSLPETAEDKPWLLRSRSTVCWNPESSYWLDVAEFEKLSESPDHMAKAITLYSGDLLPEVYEDWLEAYREIYRRKYLDNLNQLMGRSRTHNDFRQALNYAKQMLAFDPLQENVMRQLMLLRYEMGDRAGALQAYQEFVDLLAKELDVPPMPETVAVFEAVRDDRVEALPGQGTTDKTAAPASLPDKIINKLPAQLTSFFGRTLDLITLQDLFFSQNPATRLLTLTGPGGSGKSRLALELAARTLPKQAVLFPDGIFFVDLSAVTHPDKVAEAIADRLEVQESGDQTILEALTAFVGARYLLLILDNFEQVAEAGPMVVELLAAAPGLRVMITSRAALQLYGEHEYPVQPLPLPEPDQMLSVEEMLEFAAVSLFVARARAYKPNFTMTIDNAYDILNICYLLDGLPLAIELAAARIKLFTPKAMVVQLHNKLAFLNTRVRNLPTRQQTLRSTIDWSYQLLGDEEKQLFRRLSLFQGSFTAEAVATVALTQEGRQAHVSMPDLALNLLVDLAEKSMIQFSQTENEGLPRFQMLSTVREYALQALRDEQQPTNLYNRYAFYFAGLAEAAIEGLEGPERGKWRDRIREDENNLLAALDFLENCNTENRAQFHLAFVIGESLARKGHFADGIASYKRAVATAEAIDDLQLQSKGWNGVADVNIEKGDNRSALVAAEKAADLAQQYLDGGGRSNIELVTALTLKGWALSRLGEFEEALTTAESAVALSEASGAPMARLVAMNLLAYLLDDVGRYQDGSKYHLGGLALARELGDRPWESVFLNNLADSYKMMGNFEGALNVFEEASELARTMSNRHVEMLVLVNTGDAHLELGQISEAEACFREALEEIEATPTFFLAFCYALLAQVCAYRGNVEEGLMYAFKALENAEEMENPEDTAYAWHALADVAKVHRDGVIVVGRRPYAPAECYQKCADYFAENGQEVERARVFIKWARYEAGCGNVEKAGQLLEEARAVFIRYDLPLFLAQLEKVLEVNPS